MRSDVIKMYKAVHTWVGITSGLALFIAFYAGAITMFEEPLDRWTSPPEIFSPIVPLAEANLLIDATLKQSPEARKGFTIHVNTSPETPARMSWINWPNGRRPGAENETYYSNLSPDGSLQIVKEEKSRVAQFIDDIHQQVGLPFEHEIAMPIMGIIALLYSVALISGVIILIPSLVKDLFAVRMGKNLKRMWLDLHNVLGIFSLPFHIIMALTAVVFAFHDDFYGIQNEVIYDGKIREMFQVGTAPRQIPMQADNVVLLPTEAIESLKVSAPGFTAHAIEYNISDTVGLLVKGSDPRYIQQRPGGYGYVALNAYTGEIISTDMMPGRQNSLNATVSSFFTLHFGSYGGTPVRWGYFILGLAGAFLFYSGNLLWIETRRKKLRKAGQVEQSRSTRVLGALTIGISMGCIAGISLIIALSKAFPSLDSTLVYYAVFCASIIWAFVRGAARGAVDLLFAAATASILIPVVSLLSLTIPGFGWNHSGSTFIIDIVAMLGSATFILLAFRTNKRIIAAPVDSVWYDGKEQSV